MSDEIPSRLEAVETPALVVDLDRLEANLDRAADYAARHGLALRPHVKTHKSSFVAAAQLRRGARGLTCATPREAEVMAEECDDVLVAYPPVARPRARRLAALPPTVRLTVALDSVHAATSSRAPRVTRGAPSACTWRWTSACTASACRAWRTRLALALAPCEPDGLRVRRARVLPGHMREAMADQDAKLEALEHTLARAMERFYDAGLPPRVVSGGSTPTMWRTHEMPSVTEIRPGTYAYNDRTTVTTGACAASDCALTVLATVVSTSVRGTGGDRCGHEGARA